MYCSKSSSILILLWNTIIVAVVFLGIHFLWYGLKDPSIYSFTLSRVLITVLLSLVYAYLFNRISYNWRVDYTAGFVHVKQGGSKHCGNSLTNFANAILFSVLVSAIVILVMSVSGMIVSTMYVFILDGIRGALQPSDGGSAAAVIVQVGGATAGLELFGKTEEQPRRPM